jgi:hypothetical protein
MGWCGKSETALYQTTADDSKVAQTASKLLFEQVHFVMGPHILADHRIA